MREDITVQYARTITIGAPDNVRIRAFKRNEDDAVWQIRVEAAAPDLEDAQVYVDRVLAAIQEALQ